MRIRLFRAAIEEVLGYLRVIHEQGTRNMAIQDDINAAVQANTDSVNQIITARSALKTQVAGQNDQIAQLQSRVASGNIDPVAMSADLAALKATSDAIHAALPEPPAPPAATSSDTASSNPPMASDPTVSQPSQTGTAPVMTSTPVDTSAAPADSLQAANAPTIPSGPPPGTAAASAAPGAATPGTTPDGTPSSGPAGG